MSLKEIIAELPRLSDEERWEVIERAMELDDFSEEELKLIEDRLADRDPKRWVPLEQALAKLREEGRIEVRQFESKRRTVRFLDRKLLYGGRLDLTDSLAHRTPASEVN